MPVPPEYLGEIARMPAALRKLIEDELNAGNEIAGIGHSFPAAPVGCYVMLARPVSSRPRASSEGVDFYDRNTSTYSGEYADGNRHFFVLEPPRPAPPEPDMDAIRAGVQPGLREDRASSPRSARGFSVSASGGGAVDRFAKSMEIDYEKWHDGIGYDIDIIRGASPEERSAIEELLLSRPVEGWRDVEALAALDSPRADEALRKAFRRGSHEARSAVIDHAPRLVSEAERVASLVSALGAADFYGGLSRALDHAAAFHPPEVIDALFRGVLRRDGETAVHFAAMLMFLHGKASEPFDWAQRPFFLLFHTDDAGERRKYFRELCAKIGVDPEPLIRRSDA